MKSRAPRILVVEDDRQTADTIRLYLEHDGFTVGTASDGSAALAACRASAPDLVILDRMLPLLDGIEVCRQLRRQGPVGIIMLTARTTESDKLEGLACGADDYVTKPFSPRELVARVHAVLRRSASASPSSLQFGDLELHPDRMEVRLAGAPVSLTVTEYKLLETLCRAPGRVFTRADLLERVFGWDYDGTERTVDVHVANLRRKLGRPDLIATVVGAGYRFAGAAHD